MPRSDDAALQQRERGFHGIRVQIANRVDAILVLDGLVFTEFSRAEQGVAKVRALAPAPANTLHQGLKPIEEAKPCGTAGSRALIQSKNVLCEALSCCLLIAKC